MKSALARACINNDVQTPRLAQRRFTLCRLSGDFPTEGIGKRFPWDGERELERSIFGKGPEVQSVGGPLHHHIAAVGGQRTAFLMREKVGQRLGLVIVQPLTKKLSTKTEGATDHNQRIGEQLIPVHAELDILGEEYQFAVEWYLALGERVTSQSV